MHHIEPLERAIGLLVISFCLAAFLSGRSASDAQEAQRSSPESTSAELRDEDSEAKWLEFLGQFGRAKDVLFLLYKDFEGIEDPNADWLVIPTKMFSEYLQQELGKKRGPQQDWPIITNLTLKGTLEGDVANLQATITGYVEDSEGAMIDLQLQEASCKRATSSTGELPLLQKQPEGPYRLVITKKGEFRYTLDLVVEIDRTFSEPRLRLSLPYATLKNVELSSPVPLSLARDDRSGRLLNLAKKGRVIKFHLDQESSLDLSWRTRGESQLVGFSTESVWGEISYRVDELAVKTTAQLRIRSRAMSRAWGFLLPADERILSVSASQGQEILELETQVQLAEDHTRLEVTFTEPILGMVQLRITSERSFSLPGKLVLGRVEMEGAEDQTGEIRVFSSPDCWVSVKSRHGLERLDPARMDSKLPRTHPLSAFGYFDQPAFLELDVTEAQPILSATSETSVDVSKTAVEIETRFEFDIQRAYAEQLRVRIPLTEGRPWVTGPKLAGIERIASAANSSSGSQELVIRLSEPTMGELEFTLRTTMKPKLGEPNTLVLPAPVGPIPCPGIVKVGADPDIQLELDAQGTQNLRLSASASSLQPPAFSLLHPEPIWNFEHRHSQPVLTFIPHLRPRKILATIVAKFRVGDQEIGIESKLQFRAVHGSIQNVPLLIPEGVDSIRIQMGKRSSANFRSPKLLEIEATGPGIVPYRLTEPTEECELLVNYRYPIPESAANRSPDSRLQPPVSGLSIRVPLVLPVSSTQDREVSVSSYQATIVCDASFRAEALDPWNSHHPTVELPVDPAERSSLMVLLENPSETLRFLPLRFTESAPLAMLVVSNVLVEENLRGDGNRWGWVRMLLAKHRLRELRLNVPPGCRLLEVYVDGERMGDRPRQPAPDGERLDRIELPGDDRACSVEFSYFSTSAALGEWDHVSLSVPSIADAAAIGEVRWLLRVGGDRLVLGTGFRSHTGIAVSSQQSAVSFRNYPVWKLPGILCSPVGQFRPSTAREWLRSADPSVRWVRANSENESQSAANSFWMFESWGKIDSLELICVREPFWILICSGLCLVIGLAVLRSRPKARLRVGVAAMTLAIVLLAVSPPWAAWLWMGAQWGVFVVLIIVLFRMLSRLSRRRRYGRSLGRDSAMSSLSFTSILQRLGIASAANGGTAPAPITKVGLTVDLEQSDHSAASPKNQ